MRTSAVLTAAAATAALALGGAVTASAGAAPDSSPRAVCADLAETMPEAYAFLETKPGGCVSSIASVGLEALMAGAFPSQAAAVGNCKFLEENFFGGYPYAFYGQVDDPRFVAKNRAGCVRVLERLHTGEIAPPF